MKKIIAVIAILTLSIGVFYSCGKKDDNVVKIGAILPLTGSGSAYGIDCKKGIELAFEEIKKKNLTIDFELIIEDDKTDPNQATTVIQKLINVDKVKYIIGTVTSSSMLAVSPIAEKNKVILLSPSSSNPKITSAGEYIFRNWISDNFEGTVMANYLYTDEKITKISILYINNDYGNGLRQVFKTEFEKLGGKIIYDEGFNQDQTDFKTILNKIKNSDTQYIYMPGYYKEMANILIQAKNIDLKIPFRSTVTAEEPELLKIAGNAADNLVYTMPYYNPESKDSLIQNFVSSFNKRYNSIPGVFAAHGYDAALILTSAIEIAKDKNNTSDVKNILLKTKNFEGVSGKTSFDENGDVVKPVAIKKIENMGFSLLKIYSPKN